MAGPLVWHGSNLTARRGCTKVPFSLADASSYPGGSLVASPPLPRRRPDRDGLLLPARDGRSPHPGRLRHVPGIEGGEGTQLPALPVSRRRSQRPVPHPRAYRPQRSRAETREGRLRWPDLRDGRNGRSCVHHAPGLRLHPGDGGRSAQPPQQPPRARDGVTHLHARGRHRVPHAVPARGLRPMAGCRPRFPRPLLECGSSSRLGLHRDGGDAWR